MKKKVIAIVGPTAVGKTRLSIEIAKRFNGEIISGDSMQVYQKMDIGTAKIKPEEREGIPHYMIDTLAPDASFSVADFQQHVQTLIDYITAKGKLPIIAGGSGLYIQAALFQYNFSPQKRNEEVTNRLEQELEDKGIDTLYERLNKIDPQQAEKIHPNNHRRVIRALELYETTGTTMSSHMEEQRSESPYDFKLIGLEMERPLLYERINQRVDMMMNQGLVHEVKSLYDGGLASSQSMQGIGYKELVAYFNQEYSLVEAIDLIKRNSRRYAKRQYTWFKNKMDVDWYQVEPESIDEKFRMILEDLAGFLKDK
ncbi:tRNA (adenosine(37)-N6)-dimethylallyltransferase MiaA [Virgibacillus sp. LDC-1]|uniref:tRNA (adenosine(37)-N6)-dimethylallyltransferase MiaA n=1 Tax=Virgibacillus sp. LDC-1 TaxID=3039856 RepID=UPI0024DE38D8|nr:tRNA (adenosine(37)-N6)-dimethylallyltransferase MiaA [Virgibacillus sp. LDC-1]